MLRLNGQLTLDSFRLTLNVERGGKEIVNDVVFTSLPDEIIFAHLFKNLQFDGDNVIATNRFGDETLKYSISKGRRRKLGITSV